MGLLSGDAGGGAAGAAARESWALVIIEDAILATTDGQNADKALDAEFGTEQGGARRGPEGHRNKAEPAGPGKTERRGAQKLQQEVDDATVVLNAKMDQADADLDKAQKETLAELGKKNGGGDRGVRHHHGLRDGVRH